MEEVKGVMTEEREERMPERREKDSERERERDKKQRKSHKDKSEEPSSLSSLEDKKERTKQRPRMRTTKDLKKYISENKYLVYDVKDLHGEDIVEKIIDQCKTSILEHEKCQSEFKKVCPGGSYDLIVETLRVKYGETIIRPLLPGLKTLFLIMPWYDTFDKILAEVCVRIHEQAVSRGKSHSFDTRIKDVKDKGLLKFVKDAATLQKQAFASFTEMNNHDFDKVFELIDGQIQAISQGQGNEEGEEDIF